MFEYFAAEYGWTHGYILDYLTPSQFKLYSEMLLCRLDDDKMDRQELSIIQGGGNVQEFRKNRKSMRDMIKRKIKVGKDSIVDEGPTSNNARQWLASMGVYGDKIGLK